MKLIQLPQILLVGLLTCSAGATAQTAGSKKPLDLNLPPADVTPAAAVSVGPGSGGVVAAGRGFALSRRSDTSQPHQVPMRGAAPAEAAAQVASSTAAGSRKPPVDDQPGVYYGDHSVDMDRPDPVPDVPPCDDSTYNQPQVHGSISTGIVSGSHIGTGTYSSGVVNVSKAFGSCEHPGGGISISVGGATDHGFDRYRRR